MEGWAEELLIPSLARKMKTLDIIQKDLTESGISLVNVGSKALLRYSKIFQRQNASQMDTQVSVLTDLDLRPIEFVEIEETKNALAKYLNKQREENPSDFNEERAKKDFRKKHKIITEYNVNNEKQIIESKYNGQTVKTFVSPGWTLEYCIAMSPSLAPILFEAIKKAGEEMQNDGYSGKQIDNEWSVFSREKTQQQIAFELYVNFIGYGKKISKSIIAQHFAQLLEADTTITKTDLENDDNISYLMDAVKYAGKT